jgi:hypothetical protein
MPHQKHLIVGISGEIRNRLIRYRSKQETGEDYYPRLESVSDNFGNFWSSGIKNGDNLFTQTKLRPGDILEFTITARDPLGEPLEFRIGYDNNGWQDSSEFRKIITEKDVSNSFKVAICVRSHRKFHAWHDMDDNILFDYMVLPPFIINNNE